jgi:two-component system nitrate/nitrite sensor histidine kinase NarX
MKTEPDFLQHSLLLKLGGMLALIASFAILGMASPGIIAESVQGSGEAINLAGGLRMQAYTMTSLALMVRQPEGAEASVRMRTAIDRFESTLTDARITAVMPRQADAALARSYAAVLERWHTRVKPRFLSETADRSSLSESGMPLFEDITLFVDEAKRIVPPASPRPG